MSPDPKPRPPKPTPHDPRDPRSPSPPQPSPTVPSPTEPAPDKTRPTTSTRASAVSVKKTPARVERVTERRVREAIRRSRVVSEHNINVRPLGGGLVLRGPVHSFREKREAERIARRAGRVRIHNELRVDYPTQWSEREIARNVRRALRNAVSLDASTVTVYAKGAKVILRGTVISSEQQRALHDLALGAPGVKTVLNLVRVDAREQLVDRHAARSILDRLRRNRDLSSDELTVAVAGGTAVLSGVVHSRRERRLAERVALEFPIRQVRNRIRLRNAA